jgi:hypothetical protein
VYWGAILVLMTLELMFLLIKIVFAPASVYTVRLIARTKAEAATVNAEFERKMQDIQQGRPRRTLRVVGGAPDGGPGQNGERRE